MTNIINRAELLSGVYFEINKDGDLLLVVSKQGEVRIRLRLVKKDVEKIEAILAAWKAA